MYILDSQEEWESIHTSDLWIYNKLILSRVLGYICGPVGSDVPRPDFYIVRPVMNLLGMGRFARKEWIERNTEHYHPGEFWCEIFHGPHISVDFREKKSELVVLGTREPNDPLYKWSKWEKLNEKIEFPEILNDLVGDYEYINCEFIGDKLIEVHFRQNSDFRYGNNFAIPVWDEETEGIHKNYNYIRDEDYLRKGFYID
jgi:hypothetical protein